YSATTVTDGDQLSAVNLPVSTESDEAQYLAPKETESLLRADQVPTIPDLFSLAHVFGGRLPTSVPTSAPMAHPMAQPMSQPVSQSMSQPAAQRTSVPPTVVPTGLPTGLPPVPVQLP